MQNVVRCAVHCVFCESDTVLLQNLDASTLETYIQQLQDHFSKGTKHDSASEDQQVCGLTLDPALYLPAPVVTPNASLMHENARLCVLVRC